VSLPPAKFGTDWYYHQKEKSPTGLVFKPVTEDSNIRPEEESSAQTSRSAERYFTFRKEGDTSHEETSTDPDDDEEEDLSLEEKSESTDNKDRKAPSQGGLIEVEEGYLARGIQQATILDTRQN
jgi:predicted Zn-dependent protease